MAAVGLAAAEGLKVATHSTVQPATLDELAAIWGDDYADKAEYLAELIDGDQQTALADIVHLAKLRSDQDLLTATLARIESPDLRLQLSFTPCLEAGRRLGTELASRESCQAA